MLMITTLGSITRPRTGASSAPLRVRLTTKNERNAKTIEVMAGKGFKMAVRYGHWRLYTGIVFADEVAVR
jgi:hypothetical protein